MQKAGPVKFVAESAVRKILLKRLSEGPKTPTELATLESKHVSHVSRALRELSSIGAVEMVEGHSRERYYRMTASGYLLYVSVSRVK